MLPKEAKRVAAMLSTKPLNPASARLKPESSGQNTRPMPVMPRHAPQITLARTGVFRKIRPLRMFQKTMVENITATMPLVRCTSAR